MASEVVAKRSKLESVGGECKCHGKLPDDRFNKLRDVIDEYKDKSGSLIPVLHEAQQLFGCLPEDVQEFVAKGLGVPESEVYGVATFYSLFSLKPKGKWTISVCLGTACYVKGAANCLEALKKELGTDIGGTSEDGYRRACGNPEFLTYGSSDCRCHLHHHMQVRIAYQISDLLPLLFLVDSADRAYLSALSA